MQAQSEFKSWWHSHLGAEPLLGLLLMDLPY